MLCALHSVQVHHACMVLRPAVILVYVYIVRSDQIRSLTSLPALCSCS